ncbi:MAG TPA: hypothetical protein VGB39_01185 [Sphingomicrobium sp.]
MVLISLLILAAVTPREAWLVGGWAPQPSDCGSSEGIRFETDGSFNDQDSEGLWVLEGDLLTVSSMGGDDFARLEVIRVTITSPAWIEMQMQSGVREKFYRCRSG